jgi:hypothetical protein
MGWMLVGDQVYQGIGKTELRIRISPLGRDPGTADQRIIGAKDQRHGIEKEDPFIHRAKIGNSGEAAYPPTANIFSFSFGFAIVVRYFRTSEKAVFFNFIMLILTYLDLGC